MEYILKQTVKGMSQKKLENYLSLCKIIQWGRNNPIKYVELFYGIEFLDYQKYVFMKSWTTPNVVWLFSRNGSKTTMGGIYIMAKSNLIPNFRTYILSGSGQQAQELFLKIEDISKKNIATFTGLTDVFFNETVKSAANTTGFTHNPSSFGFDLYNGSKVRTLNSDFNNNRGKRSNCNYYDESGFCPDDLFSASEPFLAQNSNFRLGGDLMADTMPKQLPNQKIYASSASSIDTYFYSKYREYSKKMFLGDPNFFVADINCDAIISATFNGKLYPVPLLERREVDDALRQNPEKALREYYNKFTTEGGDNQIVKRASIIRNSESYPPIMANNNKGRFGISFDPAHDFDMSIALVGEFIEDENIGWYLKICNCVSFLDVGKKKKKQIRTPEQVDYIKHMLIDYNGKKSADYENIEVLLVDSGAGGGGHIIGDYFMEDWKDKRGISHKGLIDKIESEQHVSKFPNAVDKIKLVNPKKYKNEMFAALEEMIKLDLIKFPNEYDMKDFIFISKDKYEDSQESIDDDILVQKGEREIIKYDLSMDERLALIQIDLTKEEMVNIYRYENSTNTSVSYGLAKDKERKMHDDRCYCAAMLAWHLQQKRRENITKKKKKVSSIAQYQFFN